MQQRKNTIHIYIFYHCKKSENCYIYISELQILERNLYLLLICEKKTNRGLIRAKETPILLFILLFKNMHFCVESTGLKLTNVFVVVLLLLFVLFFWQTILRYIRLSCKHECLNLRIQMIHYWISNHILFIS